MPPLSGDSYPNAFFGKTKANTDVLLSDQRLLHGTFLFVLSAFLMVEPRTLILGK